MLNLLLVGRKVEDSRCLNKPREAGDPRDKCHQVPRVQNRVAGQRKDGLRTGVCTHNSVAWSIRWSAPTGQMSLCQRQPEISEGVFQW